MPINDDEFRSGIFQKLDLIIFWLKMVNRESVRTIFKAILDSEQKLKAYSMSDGNNTIEDIMAATGIKSKATISGWWKEWLEKGIVQESQSHGGRKEKIIDLSDLGL
jgi:hypothetical protein